MLNSLGHYEGGHHIRRRGDEAALSLMELVLLKTVFLSVLGALLMNLSRYGFHLDATMSRSKVAQHRGVDESEEDIGIAMLCGADCKALNTC